MTEENTAAAVKQENIFSILIFTLAVLLGFLYTFLMPPWQHYDEPNHFEYAILTAQLKQLPNEDSYSPKISRQVLKSMLANGFYDRLYEKPEIQPPDEKIRVPGYSQLSEPPLYYFFASVPVRMLAFRSLEAQLYAARIVSVFFLLITVLAGWRTASEITPPAHPLRWMLPLTIIFTPAFMDLMSAVNNDAAAVGVTSVYIWITVRLIHKGFSWLDFGALLVTCLLMFFTKITAVMALSVLPLTFLFTFLRGTLRKYAWIIIIGGSSIFLAISFRGDDPSGWYRSTSQSGAIRQRSDIAPIGNHVFSIQSGAARTPAHHPEVFQHIPADVGTGLAGSSATLGFWIWSDQPQMIQSPVVRTTTDSFSENISISTDPIFFAYPVDFPQDVNRIWIDLSPRSGIAGSNIYIDGIVLTEGRFPINEPPSFSSEDGESGIWGTMPFRNYIRNGSAEKAGPRVSAWLDNRAAGFLPDGVRPSLLLASLVDPEGSFGLYSRTAIHLFQTFWARFAWGQVPLIGGSLGYWILGLFTMLGMMGFMINIMQKNRIISLELVFVLGLLAIQYCLMALTRGGAYLAVPGFYIAVARHLYPTILIILLFIVIGWLQLFAECSRLCLNQQPDVSSKGEVDLKSDLSFVSARFYFTYIIFFLILNVISIVSIIQYYGSIL